MHRHNERAHRCDAVTLLGGMPTFWHYAFRQPAPATRLGARSISYALSRLVAKGGSSFMWTFPCNSDVNTTLPHLGSSWLWFTTRISDFEGVRRKLVSSCLSKL